MFARLVIVAVAACSLPLIAGLLSCSVRADPIIVAGAEQPWVAPRERAQLWCYTEKRFGSEGSAQWLVWTSLDGAAWRSQTLLPGIDSFLKAHDALGSLRLAPMPPYPYGLTFPGTDGPHMARVAHTAWILVALNPVVLVSVEHDTYYGFGKDGAGGLLLYLTSPLSETTPHDVSLALGYGVLLGTRIPRSPSPRWCSPTLGIPPRCAALDADGAWTIGVPWGTLVFTPDGDSWVCHPERSFAAVAFSDSVPH